MPQRTFKVKLSVLRKLIAECLSEAVQLSQEFHKNIELLTAYITKYKELDKFSPLPRKAELALSRIVSHAKWLKDENDGRESNLDDLQVLADETLSAIEAVQSKFGKQTQFYSACQSIKNEIASALSAVKNHKKQKDISPGDTISFKSLM